MAFFIITYNRTISEQMYLVCTLYILHNSLIHCIQPWYYVRLDLEIIRGTLYRKTFFLNTAPWEHLQTWVVLLHYQLLLFLLPGLRLPDPLTVEAFPHHLHHSLNIGTVSHNKNSSIEVFRDQSGHQDKKFENVKNNCKWGVGTNFFMR